MNRSCTHIPSSKRNIVPVTYTRAAQNAGSCCNVETCTVQVTEVALPSGEMLALWTHLSPHFLYCFGRALCTLSGPHAFQANVLPSHSSFSVVYYDNRHICDFDLYVLKSATQLFFDISFLTTYFQNYRDHDLCFFPQNFFYRFIYCNEIEIYL